MHKLATKRAHELSRGQKQLIAIAHTLGLEPSALMMDKPAAGMHSGAVRLLESLILNKASAIRLY